MLGKGLAKGKVDATVAGYKGSDNLTRAEAAQFVRNFLDKADSKTPLARPATASDLSKLPSLPVVDQTPVATGNGLTSKIQAAVGSGYVAKTSSDASLIAIADPNTGNNIATYGDGRADGGSQMFVVYKTFNSDLSINTANLKATVAMMQAVGISADDTVSDAMTKVLSSSTKSMDVTVNGTTVRVVRAGSRIMAYTVE